MKEYLGTLLKNYGDTVMLAYGHGSIKKNGVYDEIISILNAAEKKIIEFFGIMPNPTYVFGTGSEMNAGAVITHEEKKIKAGAVPPYLRVEHSPFCSFCKKCVECVNRR